MGLADDDPFAQPGLLIGAGEGGVVAAEQDAQRIRLTIVQPEDAAVLRDGPLILSQARVGRKTVQAGHEALEQPVLDARLASNLLAGQRLALQVVVLHVVAGEQIRRVLQLQTLLRRQVLIFEGAALIDVVHQGIEAMLLVAAERAVVREGVGIGVRVDVGAKALLVATRYGRNRSADA